MASITLDKIVKNYGASTAVHGIDLQIADGEFVVLVGPSGCGQSTTLRMIAGLESISGGTLKIGDRMVNHMEPKQRNIAMVFQNYAIYPHMTVHQNIGFGLYTSKLSKADKDARVQEAGKILGLSHLLERRPAALSGGQRQRVAIGRAMVRDPQAFLFDEPLSNLDAQLRGQMRLEIKQLHQRLGSTIVFVTHDQVEAMSMADRIVVMRDGRILQVGAPMELYNRPADMFTARFIGSPEMNMLDATCPAIASPSAPTQARSAWCRTRCHRNCAERPRPASPSASVRRIWRRSMPKRLAQRWYCTARSGWPSRMDPRPSCIWTCPRAA
ncbi:ATP-binding cassette domain-containing protein [Paracoccus sp. SSJ]|uniref:ABC transporter ATP-binding protein n=1 Tax=Paracoccus sp. SSJ TaxID=3050636 RepID=UPI00254D8E8F|nr:ATP-binding cassette domain-containing protein [Paracoccus sp. SSJ]MDK8874250.1 ATP-binding cassette domain-containing protein [Paracoccus sp. SSJ]